MSVSSTNLNHSFPKTSPRKRETSVLWRIPNAIGKSPSPRWGHSSSLIEIESDIKRRLLFIFGGWNGKEMLNDCYFFDIDRIEWTKCETKGKNPTPRAGHTTTTMENGRILLLGGGNGEFYLSDLFILDVKNGMEWIQPKVSSTVKVYLKDDMIINEQIISSNGSSTISQIPSDSTNQHITDDHDFENISNVSKRDLSHHENNEEQIPTKKDTSNQDQQDQQEDEEVLGTQVAEITDTGFGTPSGESKIKNHTVTVKEVYPAPRSRHSATLVDNKVIMFGGGGKNKIFGDLWILDLKLLQWSQPKTYGTPPTPRWGHTASLVGTKMYIFGGVDDSRMLNTLYELDTESFQWRSIELPKSGPIPAPRAAHSADGVDGKILILWGGDDTRFLDDLFVYDVRKNIGKRLTFKTPKARCAHSTTIIGTLLFVFGGGDGVSRFRELYTLDTIAAIKKSGIDNVKASPMSPRHLTSSTKPSTVTTSNTTNTTSNSTNDPSHVPTNTTEKFTAEISPENQQNTQTKNQQQSQQSQQHQQQEQQYQKQEQQQHQKQGVGNIFQSKDDQYIDIKSEVILDGSIDHHPDGRPQRRRKSSRYESQIFSAQNAKEVTNWLVSLGLGRYASLFIEEEIDLDCIPLLSETDLFRLGVSKYGPRKKILAAARRLSSLGTSSPVSEENNFLNNTTSANNSSNNSKNTSKPDGTQDSSTCNSPDDRNTQNVSVFCSQQSINSMNSLNESISNLAMVCESMKETVKTLCVTLSMIYPQTHHPYIPPPPPPPLMRRPMVPPLSTQFKMNPSNVPSSPTIVHSYNPNNVSISQISPKNESNVNNNPHMTSGNMNTSTITNNNNNNNNNITSNTSNSNNNSVNSTYNYSSGSVNSIGSSCGSKKKRKKKKRGSLKSVFDTNAGNFNENGSGAPTTENSDAAGSWFQESEKSSVQWEDFDRCFDEEILCNQQKT